MWNQHIFYDLANLYNSLITVTCMFLWWCMQFGKNGQDTLGSGKIYVYTSKYSNVMKEECLKIQQNVFTKK